MKLDRRHAILLTSVESPFKQLNDSLIFRNRNCREARQYHDFRPALDDTNTSIDIINDLGEPELALNSNGGVRI